MNLPLFLTLLCALPSLAFGKDSAPNAAGGKNSSKPFLYFGNTTLMQTSSAINLTIKTVGANPKVLTSVLVPPVNASTITAKVWNDTKNKVTVSSFKLTFKGPIKGSNSGSFSSLAISFEAALNSSTSYWKMSNLTVDYTAQAGGTTYEGKGEKMDVDSKPGYTRANVDQSCERHYTSCAPEALSWSCDGQQFFSVKFNGTSKPNETSRDATGGGYGVSMVLPGFRYQPLFSNKSKSKARFGSNWDCDALIPLPVWTGIFIMVGFLIIFLWSVYMITDLRTPDRFDNPKGKAIMVPTTD